MAISSSIDTSVPLVSWWHLSSIADAIRRVILVVICLSLWGCCTYRRRWDWIDVRVGWRDSWSMGVWCRSWVRCWREWGERVDWMVSWVSCTRRALVWTGRGVRGRRKSDVYDTWLFIKCKGDWSLQCDLPFCLLVWYCVIIYKSDR